MILGKTTSICPVCLDIVEAQVIDDDGRLYLEKECGTHGHFRNAHPWDTPEQYNLIRDVFDGGDERIYPGNLVVDVTLRCDSNCPYCYARANESNVLDMSRDDILTIVSRFRGSVIYLCGGEPTIRDDLLEIIGDIKKQGFSVVLYTNGKKLVNIDYLRKLRNSGLDLVILSFDTLDDRQYIKLRDEKLTEVKRKVVENARLVGIPLSLFMMVVKEININQIKNILEYAEGNDDIIKVVSFNPVCPVGRLPETKPTLISDVLVEINKYHNLSLDDFKYCTSFSRLFYGIQERLFGRKDTHQSACEMRCYLVNTGTDIIPLNRLLDLKKLNKNLDKIHNQLEKKTPFSLIKSLFYIPYSFLIEKFLFNATARSLFLNWVLGKIRGKTVFSSYVSASYPRLHSIIIKVNQTKENIDLNLVKRCTLYSNMKNGELKQFCMKNYE